MADSVHDVVTLPKEGKHGRDECRWMLQISIHRNYGFASCIVQGGGNGNLMPKIARE